MNDLAKEYAGTAKLYLDGAERQVELAGNLFVGEFVKIAQGYDAAIAGSETVHKAADQLVALAGDELFSGLGSSEGMGNS